MNHVSQRNTHYYFLDAQGKNLEPLPSDISLDWLRAAYRHMVLIRALDKKVVALQRTGQMRTYPSCLGQEALGVGIGLALQENDIFVPYYRDQATLYLRGVALTLIMQIWGSKEAPRFYRGSSNCQSQGFNKLIPFIRLKSSRLRVTSVMPCTMAVAPIMASRSQRGSGK